MAKTSFWPTWNDMARDVSRVLYRLGVNGNFADGEFRFKAYTPEVGSVAAMPLGDRTGVLGRYFDLGSLVYFSVVGRVVIKAGGVANAYVYISLPFPYDPLYESMFRFSTLASYSGGLLSFGPWANLARLQWFKLALLDSTTGASANHIPGQTLAFEVSGIYEKDPKYHYNSVSVTPEVITF